MKRILVLVEGQTEERFVKTVLLPAYSQYEVSIAPVILKVSRSLSGPGVQGGVTSFRKYERDVRRLLTDDTRALVTTMLDYYGLPADYPGMASRPNGRPDIRVRHVEAALRVHFDNPRFLPYLALHEFEALLFSSHEELPRALGDTTRTAHFTAIIEQFSTPEEINEQPGRSPSQRIMSIYPEYRKVVHGPPVAGRIGLHVIRAKCPHFNEWCMQLERFAQDS